MDPTGVSDELVMTHLTPPATETSSLESRRLYTTARDLTRAAEHCGVVVRSSSLPNVHNGLEQNEYCKRILTPVRNLRRNRSENNIAISLSPWEVDDQLRL